MAGKNTGTPKVGTAKSAKLAHITQALLGFHAETIADAQSRSEKREEQHAKLEKQLERARAHVRNVDRNPMASQDKYWAAKAKSESAQDRLNAFRAKNGLDTWHGPKMSPARAARGKAV